ncbi:bleomycin resistance protein [Jannaschia sp. CCS1]|uniref:bleomycin resistance protein n=1 Tax=Jannaschia sp. (strain CCS1) TaxID=290400 RepID=UPI000053A31E|nr:VOC family protein [Jannaschia sp. CCS1]ABD53473.1 Glyoxalase/bleomycin resistance protein/dioxygenase [Jannaschia sp. CCS1]
MDDTTDDDGFWAQLVPELSVRDLDQSLRFYRDVLGFSEKIRRPEDRFSYLELGQAQIMIEEVPENTAATWQTGPLEAPFGRGLNLQIEVEHARALHDRIVAAGYKVFAPLKVAWYRDGTLEHGQEQFLVQDPDGYLLRFMKHLGTRVASDP